jgi:hypothetical protein
MEVYQIKGQASGKTFTFGGNTEFEAPSSSSHPVSNNNQTGSDLLGSSVHKIRVNAVQMGLNSMAYGMSLTQDRTVYDKVVGYATIGSVAVGYAQYRGLLQVGARANLVTGGFLAAYTAYDLWDNAHGDHTGRKLLIGL